MRIDFRDGCRNGAASSEGHSQVVNIVCGRISAQFCQLFQRSFHPERKVAVLERSTGRNSNSESHVLNFRS